MRISLKQTFLQLVARYQPDTQLAEKCWKEITHHYAEAHRHYHTLAHLENLFGLFNALESEIADRDAMAFAIFYHDLVYNPTSNQNEIQSAERACERLQELSFPENRIAKCRNLILATQTHTQATDHDTDLFTDMDLAILGQDWDAYQTYARQVRQEYAVYPDALYNPGRKKVLEHFLQMPRIYKTPCFFQWLEARAKANLKVEIALL